MKFFKAEKMLLAHTKYSYKQGLCNIILSYLDASDFGSQAFKIEFFFLYFLALVNVT